MMLFRFTRYQAGHTKRKLEVDDRGSATFSYTEKGRKRPDRPSIVFVHGLSSNKETWIPVVKVSKLLTITISRRLVLYI